MELVMVNILTSCGSFLCYSKLPQYQLVDQFVQRILRHIKKYISLDKTCFLTSAT